MSSSVEKKLHSMVDQCSRSNTATSGHRGVTRSKLGEMDEEDWKEDISLSRQFLCVWKIYFCIYYAVGSKTVNSL